MTDSILRSYQYYSQTTTIPFPGQPGLLIDTYPATGAYSFRKLSNSYAGSAVRIRRSSDNAEADIGFDVDGEFDTAAAAAHIGGGSGFIRTWYDQSGNGRDATQTTAASQPTYDATGLNGGPSIGVTAATPLQLALPGTVDSYINADDGFSLFVVKPTNFGLGFFYFHDIADYISFSINNTDVVRSYNWDGASASVQTSNTITVNVPSIMTWAHTGGVLYAHLDGGTEVSVASGNTQVVTSTLFIPAVADAEITEVIWWDNQSTARAAIRAAVNDYYGIY